MRMTGRVEGIQYTIGGAGNQWTTIDGVKYATWWNWHTKDWQEGDLVTFTTYQAKLWANSASEIACAQGIRRREEIQ